jgi:hypothetical protein
MRSFMFAALFAAAALSGGAASADTIEVVSGQQRSFQLAAFGPTGQSFVAIDSNLTSFGFQFNALNPGSVNLPFTFTLREGAGFGGAVVSTIDFTLPTSIDSRTPTWFDFDVTGTDVTIGNTYTAILSSSSARNGVVMGPDINIFTGQELSGDAYLPGRAFFTTPVYPNCAITGHCDLNFRVTGVTPAGAVPEPASWALMIAGFGLAGGALRRRRAPAFA